VKGGALVVAFFTGAHAVSFASIRFSVMHVENILPACPDLR